MKIKCRYQYISKDGVKWTQWFDPHFYKEPSSKEEAEEIINKMKAITSNIDKETHLKHEYKIEEES